MISVEEMKVKLRISHSRTDEDIRSNMEAARLDMSRVGVGNKDNALTDKAMELYCKAQFDYMGKGEQFRKNYEDLRNAMSMSGEYRENGKE